MHKICVCRITYTCCDLHDLCNRVWTDGGYHVTGGHLYEIYGITVLLVISAFYKHKANIVRLMNGTENKLSVGKKS